MSRIRELAKWTLRGVDAVGGMRPGPAPEAVALPPSVFLVGGPRSGSTLLYQSLLACRRFAYISNAIERLPRSGSRVASAMRMGHRDPPRDFTSNYGRTSGLAGPSEGGDFWDSVFPWDQHHEVGRGEVSLDRIEHLRRTVYSLSKTYGGAPFLAKNLWHSVRIPALDEALPNALFVVIHRDPILMAQSLLEGRRKSMGEEPGFWSIRPREIVDYAGSSPVEHTGHQLAFTYRAIERARIELGPDRFCDIRYEEFCRSPGDAVERIDSLCRIHGVELESVGPGLEPFQSAAEVRLASEEVRRLEEIFAEHWPGPHELI